MRALRIATLTLAVPALVLSACGGPAPHARPGATPALLTSTPAETRTVTATGDGQASGTPDLLTVSLGVQTNGSTAQAALATNNSEAQALIAKLKGDGVADADIQTSQLQVNPNYSQPTANTPPHVVGYTVVDMVTAKLRQLDRSGALIDDAVAAAGTDAQVSSIMYSIDDASALLATARADAVRHATSRAKAMADAAGVTLGQVRTITDVTAPAVTPQFNAVAGAASGAAGSPAPVPFQPGSEQLGVEVTVVYDIAG
jgi:hypothetical protein